MTRMESKRNRATSQTTSRQERSDANKDFKVLINPKWVFSDSNRAEKVS